MKKLLIFPLLAASAMFLATGCVYDEGGSVSVSSGYHGYDDGYSDEGPYYSYSGRRYYSSGGRYRYYEGRRPVYVTAVPRGASYVDVRRPTSSHVVVNSYSDGRSTNYSTRRPSGYNYQQAQRRADYGNQYVAHSSQPHSTVRVRTSGNSVRVSERETHNAQGTTVYKKRKRHIEE